MTTASRKDYFVYLHGLRGLAALAVFLAHSCHGFAQLYPQVQAVQMIAEFIKQAGTYAVEIFFVISGFVITQSVLRYDGWTFLKMRLLRIYPVFIFFTLLFFSANKILQLQPELDNWRLLLINGLFLNYLFGAPTLTPNAWSVVHEMWYYLLGFFVIKYSLDFRQGKLSRFMLLSSAVLALVYLAVFPLTLYFIAGVGLYIVYSRGWWRFNLSPVTVAVIVLTMVVIAGLTDLRLAWHNIFQPTMVMLFITTIAFIWFVVVESPALKFLGGRSFQFLGTISYSFYLFHPYPYFVLKKFVFPQTIGALDPLTGGIVFFTIITAVTLVGSFVSYVLLEKNIYLRFKHHFKSGSAAKSDSLAQPRLANRPS
jgi:peptidoglycan/LPS O-acetylase OafA/YrhL